MTKNAQYLAVMETQMRQWDAEVEALAVGRKKASAVARGAYQEKMKELRATRNAAQKTFQQIRLASDATGAELHAHMQAAWDTMQKTLEKISADMNK